MYILQLKTSPKITYWNRISFFVFHKIKWCFSVFPSQQYYSLFQLHDFATLDQFKYLETVHLDSLNIVDPEHKVKILTAAQILRDPKSGK